MKYKTDVDIDAVDFVPLFDGVLLVDLPPKNQVGGVIIPETAQEKINIGLVVAAGHGRLDRMTGKVHDLICRVGDVVKYRDVPDAIIKINNKEYKHIKEFDIEGFYEGATKQDYIEIFKQVVPHVFRR